MSWNKISTSFTKSAHLNIHAYNYYWIKTFFSWKVDRDDFLAKIIFLLETLNEIFNLPVLVDRAGLGLEDCFVTV